MSHVQFYVLINVQYVEQLVHKVEIHYFNSSSFYSFFLQLIQSNIVNQLVMMIIIDMYLHPMKKCFVCKHLDSMIIYHQQYLHFLVNSVVLHPFIQMVGLIVIYKKTKCSFFSLTILANK
jgi:hypothetical protein